MDLLLVARRMLAAMALVGSVACAGSAPPPADGRTPVWLDADTAIGEPERDVDDGFALVQAFQSDTLVVRGVSAVFGNAPLVRTWPITQDVVERFGPEGLRPWRGAAGPHERQAPTEATEALATALRAERLTVIALGPLTNIASLLERDPSLRDRIVQVVAVAGRRPGQRVTPGGADPRERGDENVDLDVEAMRMVIDSGVPLTLAPLELSSQVWIGADDLARLAEGPVAARFLAESSKGWLRLWQERFGADGFNPTDTLAVDLVATPGQFACLSGSVAIERDPDDDTEHLVVREGDTGRPVTYCHTPDDGFKARLLATLVR